MRAFKYVEMKHADAVEAGSLRIGTLRAYGDLETSRRDPAEGLTYAKQQPDEVITSADHPLSLISGNPPANLKIEISDRMFIDRSRNRHCFCMARNMENETAEERGQAVFEVLGLRALARVISEIKPELGPKSMTKPVHYRPSEISFTEYEKHRGGPFFKRPIFEHEREIRTVWESPLRMPYHEIMKLPDGEREEMIAVDGIKAIITGKNARIAKLLRRIR